MIFWFSGTGNSQWLAQQLQEATKDRIVAMSDALLNNETEYTLKDHERLGFVFPIYGWNIPTIVRRFINQLVLKEYKNNYTYFACTCGDDMGTTEKLVYKLLSTKGWRLNSSYAIKMPNTYVCLPGFDVDNTLLEQKKLNEAKVTVDHICQLVLEKRCGKRLTIPGALPWTKTHILGWAFHHFLTSSKKFHAENTCISCGKCVTACPLHNIHLEEGTPVWENNCTMCLSCYHHCPQHAVSYGHATQKKGQYLHH